jgi:zinc transport system permease protein
MDPFFARALAAGLGLALLSAPLGCIVVWRRMAYFGETIAQASLIGVALGVMLRVDVTAAALAVAALTAGLLVLLSQQRTLPLDTILGMTAHGALATGVIVASLAGGPSIDLVGYLFGDILAVSPTDLIWIFGGGAFVLAVLLWIWEPLLATATHEELAAADGFNPGRVKALLMFMLALTIAVAIKVVGVLLAIAFLIIPAAAARPLASSPETMAALAAAIAGVGVIGGLALSVAADTPAGPSIVAILAAIAAASLAVGSRSRSPQ